MIKKVILFLGLCLTAPFLRADNLYADFNIASYHICRGGCDDGLNEQNYGVGVTYQTTNNWRYSIGTYKNSYYKRSNYALIGKSKNYYFNGWDIATSIGIGVVTGYEGTNGYNDKLSLFDDNLQFAALPSLMVGKKNMFMTVGLLGNALFLQTHLKIM